MKVEIIKCLKDNYSYLLINEKNKNACVIDPSESKPIIDFIEKKNINLKFILNTHHHYDHVGGNKDLKKKYGSNIVGFKYDKDRIPEIDILVEDNQIWINEDFESKIIHIPGHTSGHICFYFEKEKIAFTGDTLFSLGCGKIFEGDHNQMLLSLNKIKKLPKDTKIYCGHEYTYKNAKFCIKYDSNNIDLKKKFEKIKKKHSQNLPTIPSSLEEELKSNIFLRCDKNELKIRLNMQNQQDLEVFKKVRDLKDNF